jgi:hypothetical protein
VAAPNARPVFDQLYSLVCASCGESVEVQPPNVHLKRIIDILLALNKRRTHYRMLSAHTSFGDRERRSALNGSRRPPVSSAHRALSEWSGLWWYIPDGIAEFRIGQRSDSDSDALKSFSAEAGLVKAR